MFFSLIIFVVVLQIVLYKLVVRSINPHYYSNIEKWSCSKIGKHPFILCNFEFYWIFRLVRICALNQWSETVIQIRDPNPWSESMIRIHDPNPWSESVIRIRDPNPLSKSGIRIRYPNPRSESGIRNPGPK